jgi:glycosyltransferase involved in cell wall biosynthesis
MLSPKVTVCLPTFNKARYLPTAIESVLAQEFRDYELLIVDDASTDGTAEAVQSFHDSRIKYIRNPENLGLVHNWNRCLELARAEYTIIFHDDDVMLPKLLRREVEVLESDPEVVLVHTAAQPIDSNGAVICVPPPHSWPALTSGLEFIIRNWGPKEVYVTMPSVMFRKSLALKLGAFNPDMQYRVDADLWQRLAFEGKIAYLDEVLISNRIHSSQTTQRIFANSLQMLDERLKFARATRELVAAHGANLDRDIDRRISRELASDLPELRRGSASLLHILHYAGAGVRAHPEVLYCSRFVTYFLLALLPPSVIRWLKRLHIRWLSAGWAAARVAHENRH